MELSSFTAQALFCRRCGARLSAFLRPLHEMTYMEDSCDFLSRFRNNASDCFAMLRGYASRPELRPVTGPAEGEDCTFDPEDEAFEETDFLNNADLTTNLRWSKDPYRMAGCCGPSGAHGPNRYCVCGEEVGTQSDDCSGTPGFTPVREKTIWM